ncbi:DUF916 domain-containing protein [Apilactobacillus micheneri]|uniref:WxL protein peptidoglycan domain-containing protein n=1 Tax=Apilactobacillus micheneri TaxID=1899430 RepID=UPI0011285E63|nr:DUF916 domain-containing protein [Apilactobacillus micheneri]TPR39092.1 DUF916 domain-containing protein [Apilactobacillus micheneri]TPR50623.1 DUF916 domain-containing protein [Apilactobacillus micheneri]
MKLLKLAIVTLLLLVYINILPSYKVNADSGANFSIEVVKSNNMVNKNTDYFYLNGRKNTYQTLKFFIYNNSNSNNTYNVDVNNATTNDNLSINYGNSNNKLTTKHNLTSLLTTNKHQEIYVSKNNRKLVTLHIKMPKNYYNGVLMGGITVYDNKIPSKNSGITNKFMYSIAVLLQNSKVKVDPNLEAAKSEVSKESFNDRPYVYTYLKNDKNNFINDLNTNIIIKNDHGKVVARQFNYHGTVAPISKFKLKTFLKDSLMDGKYTLYGYAKDDKNHIWSWINKFDIKNNYLVPNDANNHENQNIPKKSNYTLTILLGVSSLVVLISILITIFKIMKMH